MVSCKGLHCPGCGGGRGVAVLVVVAAIAAACARPVMRAAVDLVEVVAVTAAVLLAAVAVVTVVVWRVRRRRTAPELPARPVVLTAVYEPARLDGRQERAAIEPPRTGVSTYARIDAQPHVVTSRDARPRCAHRGERRS